MTALDRRRTETSPAPLALPIWLASVPVERWMTTSVTAVGVDTPVREAAALMKARGIRHLPVLGDDGRLAGVVSERDLRQVVLDARMHERVGVITHRLAVLPVSEVMTRDVVTVGPGTDLREAASLMRRKKIGGLPVMHGGRVVGMVTETDVLRAFEYFLRREPAPLARRR